MAKIKGSSPFVCALLEARVTKYSWPQQMEVFPTRFRDWWFCRHDNLPPNEWKLGRITREYIGADSRVRVADIRTANGAVNPNKTNSFTFSVSVLFFIYRCPKFHPEDSQSNYQKIEVWTQLLPLPPPVADCEKANNTLQRCAAFRRLKSY